MLHNLCYKDMNVKANDILMDDRFFFFLEI